MNPLFVEGFIVQANALRAAPQCMTDLNSAYLPVSVPTVLLSEIGQIILSPTRRFC